MPSSPAEASRPGIAAAADAYAAATRSFAAGDFAATAEHVELARAALATAGSLPSTDATLHLAQAQHAQLLAAVSSERDRVQRELIRLRAGRRALRLYGARPAPASPGRNA